MKRYIRKLAQKLYRVYRAKKYPATQTEPANIMPQTPPVAQPIKKSQEVEIDIIPSPNPNACKYELSVQVAEEAFSFDSVGSAQTHPLAHAVLSVDGVQSIFGFQNFITIKKHPEMQWSTLHPHIEAILQKSCASES